MPALAAAFPRLRVYAQVVAMGVQNKMIYRWSVWLHVLAWFVHLFGYLFLWEAVFAENAGVAGFNYNLMVAYYIGLIITDSIGTSEGDDSQIVDDIRDGAISQWLIKPMDYMAYRFSIFLAQRITYITVCFFPIALCLYCLRGYFTGIPVGSTWLPALAAMLGGSVLQFGMSFSLAMLTFWLLDIRSIIIISYAIESIAGGYLFPLNFLPAPVHHALMALPFAYEFHFPSSVLIGKIQGWDLIRGFAFQFAWTCWFWGLGWALWKKGLRKYTAVGG